MADNFRLRVINDRPVRLRVRPSLLPQEIELQNTGTVVQWRYVGQADDAWVDLIEIDDINATVSIGTVTTVAAGSPATVENVGTAQDVVLNFGIPEGADGVVQSIDEGTGIAVDESDPNNPIVALDTPAVVRDYLDAAPYVADRPALKALDTTKDTRAIFDGSLWEFLSGDYASLVATDTLEGIYVKATAVAAASGAWVRQFDVPDVRHPRD
jgi:hypothetical protein